MATVTLTINGRPYDIACDESQVSEIRRLGDEINDRANTLVKQVGVIPDARLLVMVALTLMHELGKAKAELGSTGADLEAAADLDSRMAAGIDALAARIESIADRLERA